MHVKNSLYSLLLALVVVSCGSPAQSDGMEELKAQYDFAIADTASITKVVISDKKPSQVPIRSSYKNKYNYRIENCKILNYIIIQVSKKKLI